MLHLLLYHCLGETVVKRDEINIFFYKAAIVMSLDDQSTGQDIKCPIFCGVGPHLHFRAVSSINLELSRFSFFGNYLTRYPGPFFMGTRKIIE